MIAFIKYSIYHVFIHDEPVFNYAIEEIERLHDIQRLAALRSILYIVQSLPSRNSTAFSCFALNSLLIGHFIFDMGDPFGENRSMVPRETIRLTSKVYSKDGYIGR